MPKLELGAGPFPQPGYDTLDGEDWRKKYGNRVRPEVVLVHDVESEEAWPVATDHYDEILSIHMLEHIDPVAVPRFFKECLRVLKPGGVLRIHVPNGPVIANAYLNIPERSEGIQICLYGLNGFHERHKCLYNPWLLEKCFHDAAFVAVKEVTNDPAYADRHDEGWEPLFSKWGKMSLKMIGYKPL